MHAYAGNDRLGLAVIGLEELKQASLVKEHQQDYWAC